MIDGLKWFVLIQLSAHCQSLTLALSPCHICPPSPHSPSALRCPRGICPGRWKGCWFAAAVGWRPRGRLARCPDLSGTYSTPAASLGRTHARDRPSSPPGRVSESRRSRRTRCSRPARWARWPYRACLAESASAPRAFCACRRARRTAAGEAAHHTLGSVDQRGTGCGR